MSDPVIMYFFTVTLDGRVDAGVDLSTQMKEWMETCIPKMPMPTQVQ